MPASLFAAVVNLSRYGFPDESLMHPSHGLAATASGMYRNQWANSAAETPVNFVLEYRSWHPRAMLSHNLERLARKGPRMFPSINCAQS
jgi:hypothetical protein